MSSVINIPQVSSGSSSLATGSPVTGGGTNRVLYTDSSGNLKTSTNLLYTETINYLQCTNGTILANTFYSQTSSNCFVGGTEGGAGIPSVGMFSDNPDDGVIALLLESVSNADSFMVCWAKDLANTLFKVRSDGAIDFVGVKASVGDIPLIWFTESESAPGNTVTPQGWIMVKDNNKGQGWVPYYQ